MMDWEEIHNKINNDIISINLYFNLSELLDVLVGELGFSDEEADALLEFFEDSRSGIEDNLRWNLATELTGIIVDKMEKLESSYPEDEPGQLHLFDD